MCGCARPLTPRIFRPLPRLPPVSGTAVRLLDPAPHGHSAARLPSALDCGTRLRATKGAVRAVPRAHPAYGRRPWPASPLPSPPEGTFHLPGRVALGQVLALVVGPLAAGERQLDLDVPVAEVQRERDQRQARARRSRWPSLSISLRCSSSFLRPPRRRGWSRCPRCTPGCGRCAATPRPSVICANPSVQRRAAQPQRLHLGAGQDESGLVGVLDVVVVLRPAVTGDDLPPLLPSHVPPVIRPTQIRR